jgi:hypothetical protein
VKIVESGSALIERGKGNITIKSRIELGSGILKRNIESGIEIGIRIRIRIRIRIIGAIWKDVIGI